GTSSSDGDKLTIKLDSPTCFNSAQGGVKTNRGVLYCKVTGGTAEYPKPVRVTKSEAGWNYGYIFFANADNDWVGNVELYAPHGNDHIAFETYLGFADVSATDSMLGDPANEVLFDYYVAQWKSGQGTYGENRLYLNNVDSAGLKRKVHGTGIIGGQTCNASFTAAACPLVLGEGFMADPALYKQGVKESDYGTQGITGSSITMKPGASLVFDVDIDSKGNLKYDKILFTSSGAPFELTGTIVVREAKALDVGTVIPAMTLAASAPDCTVRPASITPGWECSAVPNEGGGWTLQLEKVSSEPVVQCGGFSELGPDCATLTAKVLSMGSASSGELMVFYGPTDGGSDPDNWAASKSFGSVNAPGVYAIALTGLSIQPYVYRAAMYVGGALTFAIDPATFTPVPLETPGRFVWRRIEDNWDTEGAWERMTLDYARLVPGCAGDTICFDLGGRWNSEGIVYGSNAVVHIDRDVTVGGLTVSGGYNHNCDLLPADGVALVFDNNGKDSVISVGTASSTIGSLSSSGVLRMANPLEITRPGTHGASVRILCPIAGGTVDEPCGLTFSSTGDSYSAPTFALANAANDFVGDITVIRRSNAGKMTFSVGTGTILADDGMLGNVANKVHLRYSPTLSLMGSTTVTPVLSRYVDGTGTISAKRYQNQWESPKMGLALGATATLAPCGNDGTGFGTLTVDVTAFADTATTVYAIDVDADDPAAGDKVNFNVESAVELNGVFDVQPDDPSVRIPGGTRWAIGTIAASAGEVTKTRLAGNEMFKILVEGDAESGWTIYAERKQSGMTLIVR
ncbi:MAG: hypothetical protein IKC14_07100, partial [Kiritimatiellae bacterium]|nr:hypothetical protein [Kiritimatiellia bacterium]